MSESDRADGGGPSEASDDVHQLAARIAQRLRDAGLGCEIVNLVPTPTAALRRDRVVIVLAVAVLTALAWGYLLWLSAAMRMGGMDMTDFRMIPSGMALMVPADTPWRGVEFTYVLVMWTVMMVGMMTPSAARCSSSTPAWADKPKRKARHSLQLFGLLLVIFLFGSRSR